MFDGEFPDATLVCSLSFRGEGLTPSGKRWNRTDDGFIVEIVLFGRLRSVAARPMVRWDIGFRSSDQPEGESRCGQSG